MSVECVLRQSRNSLLPVDIFELQVLVAAEADRGVVTGTDGSLYAVAPAAVRKMLAGSGPLTMAFCWTQVQEEAFLREQIVRNGRQTAQERIGHPLLELHRRAQIVDQASADAMPDRKHTRLYSSPQLAHRMQASARK